MPSDLQVTNIKANDGTAGLVIADSSGQVTGTLGSATVFPAGTMCGFTETTTTPTGTQGANTSYTDVTGSSVSYTPTANSSYVVYEYTTCIFNNSVNSLGYFKFFFDGSMVANTNHAFYQPHNDADAGLGYMFFTHTLPSWSGAKILKLQYQVHNTTYYFNMHHSSYSGDSSGDNVYTKIYRRTYSVM